MSLLLMVWGGYWLAITIGLGVFIIVKYRGYGIRVLLAFWGTLFLIAVSFSNWIVRVIR
jgi:hypothetical protein